MVSEGRRELKSGNDESWRDRDSDGSACSPMAHGRMAGTCVTNFLIMQTGLSFGTKSNSPLRFIMNNDASKLALD